MFLMDKSSSKLFDLLSKPQSAGTVQKFLESHKDLINIKNDKGESPLVVALKNGSEDVALVLLTDGANPIGSPELYPNESCFDPFLCIFNYDHSTNKSTSYRFAYGIYESGRKVT